MGQLWRIDFRIVEADPARSLSELAVISNKFNPAWQITQIIQLDGPSLIAGDIDIFVNEFLALFVSFGTSVLCITS